MAIEKRLSLAVLAEQSGIGEELLLAEAVFGCLRHCGWDVDNRITTPINIENFAKMSMHGKSDIFSEKEEM